MTPHDSVRVEFESTARIVNDAFDGSLNRPVRRAPESSGAKGLKTLSSVSP
jgi:hypothetical protein